MKPVHPFPARMAPDVALAALNDLPPGASVLDPLAGSGTVLRAASDRGLRADGADLDPLAVLMSRVWTTPLDPSALVEAAQHVVARAQRLKEPGPAWIDTDPSTIAFIEYWFAEPQRAELRRLARVLARAEAGPATDALRLALSRIIVTKDRGASLARDVSHSRPHRVARSNDYPTYEGFLRATRQIATALTAEPPTGNVDIRLGDARSLSWIGDDSIDAVVTSPPYLNAIDYIRGHRLALVWLGFSVAALREIRSTSIGAERAARDCHGRTLSLLTEELPDLARLPNRTQRIMLRYRNDLAVMMSELARVLRRSGHVVIVVGNSTLKGVFVDNARAVALAAAESDLMLVARETRELPAAHRYLPPPATAGSLSKRMREEVILTFHHASRWPASRCP